MMSIVTGRLPEASHPDFRGVLFVADGQDHEHQQERAEEFAEEVARLVHDRGHGAEYAELGSPGRPWRLEVAFPEIDVSAVRPRRSGPAAVPRRTRCTNAPRERPRHGQPDGDRGVGDVPPRIGARDQHAAHHGQAPRDCDYGPSAVKTFRLFQYRRCDDPVAQQYEHECPDEFEQALGKQR